MTGDDVVEGTHTTTGSSPSTSRTTLPKRFENACEALLEFVGERAHEALDESADDRERAFRNRALVTMLALTGARGAELFADPRDEHRNGLWWHDVNLKKGIATVIGKTRERQPIPLTDRVVESLERYRTVLDPATEDWPVFPTRHHSTREGSRGRSRSPGVEHGRHRSDAGGLHVDGDPLGTRYRAAAALEEWGAIPHEASL